MKKRLSVILLSAIVVLSATVPSPSRAEAATVSEVLKLFDHPPSFFPIITSHRSITRRIENIIVGDRFYDVEFDIDRMYYVYGIITTSPPDYEPVFSLREPMFWLQDELAREAAQAILEALGSSKMTAGGRDDFAVVYNYDESAGSAWVWKDDDSGLTSDELVSTPGYDESTAWPYAVFTEPTALDVALDYGYVAPPEPQSPVPEPATIALFGIGLLGMAGISRKRAQRKFRYSS